MFKQYQLSILLYNLTKFFFRLMQIMCFGILLRRSSCKRRKDSVFLLILLRFCSSLLFRTGRIFHFFFGEASRIMSFSLALFASLQLNWATTTVRLLWPSTCLPHRDGGIPLNVLPEDTTKKLAGFFFIFHIYPSFTRKQIISLYIDGTSARPHSLESCHFRGVWATYLPHKGGAFR